MIQTAVCLINYNAYQDTLACVESLRKGACHIVVVDNGSTNDSVEQMRQAWGDDVSVWNTDDEHTFHAVSLSAHGRVHLLLSQRNGGFAYGNNLLLRFVRSHLSTPFVLWLNNDTEVPEQFVETLERTALQHGKTSVAIAAEERNFYTGERRHAGFHYLNLPTGLAFSRPLWPSHRYICGACLFTSVEAPEWDESYFLYYEDADYAFRLRQAGFRLVSTAETYYLHKQGASTGQHRETVLKSMWHFYRLHYPHLRGWVRIVRAIQYRLCGNKTALSALNKSYESAR